MITREQYNKALDIVEAYNKQLYKGIIARRFKPISKIEAGDYVECVKPFKQSKNCLTKGKKYRVIKTRNLSNGNVYFSILDDNDKNKTYPDYNSQFMLVGV